MSHKPSKHSTIKFSSQSVSSSSAAVPPSGTLLKYVQKKTFFPVTSSIEHINVNGMNMTCKYHKCLHSLNSPAIIKSNGDQVWYKMGEIHRDEGPAVIRANGDMYWYKNGILHRDEGPAVVLKDGKHEYFLDGVKQVIN